MAAIEPMLSRSDIAALLGYSVRKLERDIAAGRLPAPDLKLGRMSRWRRSTIDQWIQGGGGAATRPTDSAKGGER